MQVDELANQTMAFAADILRAQDNLVTTDVRLKVLYQVTKLLEVCKTRESVVNQYHFSSSMSEASGGVS